MDRRTKIILFIIASVLLLLAVLWFFVWPLLQPVLPSLSKPQPPALGQPQPPSTEIPSGDQGGGTGVNPGAVTISPGANNPDIQRIIELSRRAGVLAERAESGSSQGNFDNYADAALDASPSLAGSFLAKQAELRNAHPANGPSYLTIARRLVEIPESQDFIEDDTFTVRVHLQVEVNDAGNASVEYREATVNFERQGADWVIVAYDITPFTP